MELRYRVAGLTIVVALLVGCDNSQRSNEVSQGAASRAAAAGTQQQLSPVLGVGATRIVDSNSMSRPLPEGVVLKLVVHPLKDVTTPRKNGRRSSRRVEFEILEGGRSISQGLDPSFNAGSRLYFQVWPHYRGRGHA